MKNTIAIFEIPVTEIARAISFYQNILDIEIEQMDFEGMQVGLFPSEGKMPFGVLMQNDEYIPSSNGVTIYLNAGENLQVVLDKVESAGGKTIVPKTPHADESGFFALFIDSEGNKIGLHSLG
ncbi:MAG: VOC family protein [Epsilonproteobacteria bacterium]|nr:VOC family protein [Campylobacterota bacterium]